MIPPTDPAMQSRLSSDEVRRLCANLTDETVGAILDTGATLADMETAAAWSRGEDEVLAEKRAPLTGAAAQVYDLLAAGEDFEEERMP